jgi:hypothetical protein
MDDSTANVYLTVFVRVREFFSVSPVPSLDLFHELPESRPAVRPYPHRATGKFLPGPQVEFVSVMLVSMARIPVGIVVPQKALLTSYESVVSVQEGLDRRICCTVVYHFEGLVYEDHYLSATGDLALDRQQPGFLKDEL